MRRARPLLTVALGAALIAALAFAILASKGGSGTTTSPVVSVPGEEAVRPASGGFDGAALPGSHPAPPFKLTDQYGLTMSLSSLRGEPVVLTFLYARCGAPCVLVAQQIRGALDELGGHPARVLIVSADPAGDTAPAVRAFLAEVSLSGRVHYLTGTEARLAPIWKAYGVHPAAVGAAAFAKYATVRLLDSRGRERVLYGPEQLTPEALAHDIRRLLGSQPGR